LRKKMIMGRASSTGMQRDPFRVGQGQALAELEEAWGY
jgi:hypothetical protein